MSSAKTFTFAKAQTLNLDVQRLLYNKEPMTPDISPKEYYGKVRLNWDVGILNLGKHSLLVWRNKVHTEGTRDKLQTVGWHWELGIPLGPVELMYEHHSRHVMDRLQPRVETSAGASVSPYPERFPQYDTVGIRIHFLK